MRVAQRLGLIESVPAAMTEAEWRAAKEQSNKRDDSKQPCVICKELFGKQQQVVFLCISVIFYYMDAITVQFILYTVAEYVCIIKSKSLFKL